MVTNDMLAFGFNSELSFSETDWPKKAIELCLTIIPKAGVGGKEFMPLVQS